MSSEYDIESATQKIKEHYVASKREEKELADARLEFFGAATEYLEGQPRATRTILIPSDENLCSNEEIESWVHQNYPEWRILKIEDDPFFRVLVEEDPAWMKFSYVSKDRKTVFQRGIAQASAYLDDAALKEDDPDLWMRVTRSSDEELLNQFLNEYEEYDEWGKVKYSVDQFIKRHQDEFMRILKPFEELDNDDLDAIQKYIRPGKLSYRLEKPRKPKPEELE